MDFELTDEQREIAATFDRALARESSIDRVRAAEKSGFDPDLWQVLVGMGVLDLVNGDEGEAASAATFGLVAESLGRHLACVPAIEAAVAALLLAEAGVDEEQGAAAPVAFSPRKVEGGVAWAVPGGSSADAVVVLDGSELVVVRDASAAPVDDLGFTATAHWRLDHEVERTILSSGPEALARWNRGVARWHLATASSAVGVAEQALEVAVAYAQEREQFGTPIGSFQSIQHALAEVHVDVAGARLLAREAAGRCDNDDAAWDVAAAEAYAFATRAAVRSAEVALHVHGGYGYTLEYDPQLYLRRAKALQLHGDEPEKLWSSIGARTISHGLTRPIANRSTEDLRAEVRGFLAEELTPQVRAHVGESGNYHDSGFHRALAERGWVGAHWSLDEGGKGWPRAHSDVVYEELAAAGAPVEGLAVTQIIGEAIRRVGTPEQKAKFLGPICRGEMLLALGYSEPGAGSDLASVQTRAVPDGDGWILNGQKIFTTMGSVADYVFVLARTDPEAAKHAGLTLFLLPTDAPGFSAAPIYTLSGQRTNVTYYADIRLDDSARLGEPGQGWDIVNVALAFERGGEFAAQVRRTIDAAVSWARSADRQEDPYFLARLGRATAEADVARLLGAYASWSRNSARAGAVEGTVAKVYGTEALQRVTGSLLDTAGAEGLVNREAAEPSAAGELQHLYRESQIATIYGGTSEVLKTVIAQQGLKLPRPPRRSSSR